MELGTYIGMRVTMPSIQNIEAFYQKHFDNLITDMHITLMFAKEQDCIHSYPANPHKHYTCEVVGVDVFGPKGDKWRALVLKLRCPQLTRRHHAIKKVFGLEHSYPEFKPHVSIKYAPTEQEEKEFLKLKSDIIGTKIEVTGEYVEPIKGV